MFAAVSPCAWRKPSAAHWRLRRAAVVWLSLSVFCQGAVNDAAALTPESPEVVALVNKSLGYLQTATEERLGGKCLIALAFHKSGKPASHPKIAEAIEACRVSVQSEKSVDFIYGKALAVIFLAELDDPAYRGLLEQYAALLDEHQKEHGGFGYTNLPTGDTSQTQYLALAYWELLNHGISPNADSVQQCLKWLMRTQDPRGAWGYQGQDPGSYQLVEQQLQRGGQSMAAAGMGGTLILGNALGLLRPEEPSPGDLPVETATDLPPALRRVEEGRSGRAPTLPHGSVEPQRLAECLARGRAWMNENFDIEVGEWQFYYLYSVERFKSFEEYLQGGAEESQWYDDGVKFLQSQQGSDGSFNDGCGVPCATAFATLFLLRSTQQSIKAALGEGTLVGGRGLPRDLSTVRLRGGRLVVQQNPTELDALLDMMEEGDASEYDALASNPAALEVTEVTPEAGRRLQQIVRSGPPEARLLAVRALSSARDMDYAPTLIFALTDPHRPVVRAARDGLRSVSRNFEGFGPPDNFDDNQRDEAIVRWKAWYQTARPDAAPLP